MNLRKARLEDAAAIALVHVDTWKATYPGILPEDYLTFYCQTRREHIILMISVNYNDVQLQQ